MHTRTLAPVLALTAALAAAPALAGNDPTAGASWNPPEGATAKSP